MSLRSEYDAWHQRVFEADPEHEDASSPWYQLVRELARAGARVTGCDFSHEALRAGQGKLRLAGNSLPASLVQGDAQNLPFEDDSFDAVVSCETIEHVPDAQCAVREMYRVTRPGGKLFLTTPNYLNFMGLYELYSDVRHPGRKSNQPLDLRYVFPQIRRFVRCAGWNILRTDGTVHQFPFIPGRNPVAFPGLESNRTVRRLLSPLAFHYFVVAAKRSAV